MGRITDIAMDLTMDLIMDLTMGLTSDLIMGLTMDLTKDPTKDRIKALTMHPATAGGMVVAMERAAIPPPAMGRLATAHRAVHPVDELRARRQRRTLDLLRRLGMWR